MSARVVTRNRLLVVALVAVAAGLLLMLGGDPDAPEARPPTAEESMNRGIGLLESFRYSEAREAFRQAV